MEDISLFMYPSKLITIRYFKQQPVHMQPSKLQDLVESNLSGTAVILPRFLPEWKYGLMGVLTGSIYMRGIMVKLLDF